MQKLLHITFISDPQINLNRLRCTKKNDRNEIKSVEGHRVMAMHLHDNLIKTSGYPF